MYTYNLKKKKNHYESSQKVGAKYAKPKQGGHAKKQGECLPDKWNCYRETTQTRTLHKGHCRNMSMRMPSQ